MATYKEIFGTNIEVLASDPANPVQGQVWFNSTDNVVKGFGVTGIGAWSSGSPLNTGRRSMGGAGESNSSALAFFGLTPPSTYQVLTESYNGSAWTELNDGNTARQGLMGRGIQDSAIAAGGYLSTAANSNTTETWNGTSWTTVNNLNTAKYQTAGAAQDSTAALNFGGYDVPPFPTGTLALTEQWNGTSWTAVNNLNAARYVLTGSGSSTSALAFGGDGPPPGYDALTESWNGTCWTEVNDMNSARIGLGSANGTDNTSALAIAGEIVGSVIAFTEEFNGTCWSEVGDMATAQYQPGGGGVTTSALAFGGNSPDPSPVTALTEEWNGLGSPTTVTFTSS